MERGRRTPNILFVDFDSRALISQYKLQPARSIEKNTFRVLPPLPPKPRGRSLSPRVYKMTPPRSVNRRDKASFVIITDPVQRPIYTGPDSPIGRVSPFRARGFKEPTTPRPTRENSPASDTDANEDIFRPRKKSRLPVATSGRTTDTKSASDSTGRKSASPSPGRKSASTLTGRKSASTLQGRKGASSSPKKQGRTPKSAKKGDQTSSEKTTDEGTEPGEESITSKPPLPTKTESGTPGIGQITAATPPAKRKLRHRNSVEKLIVLNRAIHSRFQKNTLKEEVADEEDVLRTPSAKRRNPNTLAAPKKLFRHRNSVERIIALNRAASPFGKLSPKEAEAVIRTPSASRRIKSPNLLAAPTRKFEKKHSIEKLIAVNRMRRSFAPAKDASSPIPKRKGSSTSRASRTSLASISRISAAASRGSAASNRGSPSSNRASLASLTRITTATKGSAISRASAASKKGSATSNRTSLASLTRVAAKGSAVSRASAASNKGSPTSNRASLASITRATAAARGSAISRASAASNRGSATSNRSSAAKSGRTSAARTSAKNRSPGSSVRRSLASSIALSHMKSLHSSGENEDSTQKGRKSPVGSAVSKKGSASPRGRTGKKAASPSIAKVTRAQMLLTEMSREGKSEDKPDEINAAAGGGITKTPNGDVSQKKKEDSAATLPGKVAAGDQKTDLSTSESSTVKKEKETKKESTKKKVYPEPSATLVRSTAAPAIELVKPDIIPEIIASVLPPPELSKNEAVPPVQEVKKVEKKNEIGQSQESVHSTDSMDEKLKAMASLKASLKKKSLAKVSKSMRGKVQGEADVEVLSANNLMKPNENSNRSGSTPRSPQVTPLTNATQAKKKTEESKSKKCSKCCKTPPCCDKLTNGISQLCSKLNCCSKSSCCKKSETSTTSKVPLWRKIFCCCKKKDAKKPKKMPSKEGCFKRCLNKVCCCCCGKKDKKKRSEESKCCAKCKSCSRGCCNGCKRGLAKCWRGIFCLNRGCCQKIRDKCCCTKANCCLPGGCCGRALMPGEERHDPKRQSTKSQRVTKKRDEAPKLDPSLLDHISVIRSAIPILPIPLAYFCLFFNTFIPGSGTLWSGLFCLCFGKARFSVKDTTASRLGSFSVNLLVSFSQAFTIIFCLVGWGWSIWWGVIMVRVARKYKRLQQAELNVPTTSQTQIDPEQGAAPARH